ncbi:MAG: hypothetical protein R2813_04715 [Flavobacteriales bacterium]
MNVSERLASFFDRKDEEPNIQLALEIVTNQNAAAVSDLVQLLKVGKRDQQSDCIKVLYEIGERQPKLIAKHFQVFLETLNHKNNRLQWGAMTALDCIALENPDLTASHLSGILEASDNDSVITKDHAVGILIKLASIEKYRETALPLLLEQLTHCATNQLPMYAERALPVIVEEWKGRFVSVLEKRIPEIDKDSKVKRVVKVIRKLQ